MTLHVLSLEFITLPDFAEIPRKPGNSWSVHSKQIINTIISLNNYCQHAIQQCLQLWVKQDVAIKELASTFLV